MINITWINITLVTSEATAAEISTQHIKKFDGKNYEAWKFQLENYLSRTK